MTTGWHLKASGKKDSTQTGSCHPHHSAAAPGQLSPSVGLEVCGLNVLRSALFPRTTHNYGGDQLWNPRSGGNLASIAGRSSYAYILAIPSKARRQERGGRKGDAPPAHTLLMAVRFKTRNAAHGQESTTQHHNNTTQHNTQSHNTNTTYNHTKHAIEW